MSLEYWGTGYSDRGMMIIALVVVNVLEIYEKNGFFNVLKEG